MTNRRKRRLAKLKIAVDGNSLATLEQSITQMVVQLNTGLEQVKAQIEALKVQAQEAQQSAGEITGQPGGA